MRHTQTVRKIFRMLSGLALAALLLPGCQPELYTGELRGNGRPSLEKGSRTVLFSMIMRKVGYANSNGLNWIARQDDDDYRELYRQVSETITGPLQMQQIEREQVLDHALYRDGRFPLRMKFFLNTAALPIITNADEEELMLRSSRALDARYFVTVLMDHSVSKVVAVPASVTSVLVFNIYSADSGLIYQAELETTATAEPYDRSLSLGDLYAGYEPILAATLEKNTAQLIEDLHAKLAQEISIREPRATEAETDPDVDPDLGF